MPPIRIAACHASPIFLSAKATTEKAISLIETASKNGANLIVFPETYIPAFPIWSSIRPPTENHDLFHRMASESIYADGEELASIRSAACRLGVMVSIGFSEKVRSSCGTLYNSNLFIGSEGQVLVHHRKLVPTFFEKLTWAPGDGHGLRVVETEFGKIGGLICGENTNPLARYALMAQGEEIHISTWPAIWPTRFGYSNVSKEEQNLSDGGGEKKKKKNYDNVAANRTRAAAHCFEAKAYGVLCSTTLGQDAIDIISDGYPDVRQTLENSQRGATMFLDATGAALPGFVVNSGTGEREEREFLQMEDGILYADIDVAGCVEGKQYHDVVGGYQRMDIFRFEVDRRRVHPAKFHDE